MRTGGHVDARGYKRLKIYGRQIAEHRYVMEQVLGRRLLSSEAVHHKNGNKADNVIDNLEVMTLQDHAKEHRPLTWSLKEAVELRFQGFSYNSIGKLFGLCHGASIRRAFRRYGIRL